MKLLSTTRVDSIEGSMEGTTSTIYVYQLENGIEFWDLENAEHDERCYMFGVVDDEYNGEVLPGAMYKTYDFHIGVNYAIMVENINWNI